MDNLAALGIGIASLMITLVIAFLIISQGRDQVVSLGACTNTSHTLNTSIGRCCIGGTLQCVGPANASATSYAYNGTQELGGAVDDIPGWVPLIVIAVIGSLLLGLVALFRR